MDRDLARLELVKLCYRPTTQFAAEDAMAAAKKLEEFIFESGDKPAVQISAESKEAAPTMGFGKKKKSDNSVFD